MAFVSMRDLGFNTPHHIFVMNADGTERRNLTGGHPPKGTTGGLLGSADGTQDCFQLAALLPRGHALGHLRDYG